MLEIAIKLAPIRAVAMLVVSSGRGVASDKKTSPAIFQSEPVCASLDIAQFRERPCVVFQP